MPVGTPLLIITSTADEPVEAPAAVSAPAARPAPASAPAAPVTRRVVAEESEGGFLSPVVRTLLDEHGLAPGDVVGSGRGGRITRADVLAAAHDRPESRPRPPRHRRSCRPPRRSTGPTTTSWTSPAPAARRPSTWCARWPRRPTRSWSTEVDYDAVDRVRRPARLSYLPFVARAVVDAIAEFPHVNASVGDDELIVHREIHLGIAVDVDFEALVVPVVTNAGDLRLRALAEAVADLAAKAAASGSPPTT